MTATATKRPIFVLGIQRSGTTLAANTLAAHPDIAGVTAQAHRGIHESVYFSHFVRFFQPWNDSRTRTRFVNAFIESDYFRLTNLEPECFRCSDAESPAAFFRSVMAAYAERCGAVAWVEKSPHHTLLAKEIAASFPDATFVCVLRDPIDLLRSRLWSYGRTPPRYPARAARIVQGYASVEFHNRWLRDFAQANERAVVVAFQDLLQDPQVALEPVFRRVGCDPARSQRSVFAPNSSFGDSQARSAGLSAFDRRFAEAAGSIVARLPPSWLELTQRRLARHRPLRFPRWVWTMTSEAPERVPIEGEKK